MKNSLALVVATLIIAFTIPTVVKEITHLTNIPSGSSLTAAALSARLPATIHQVSYTGHTWTSHVCEEGEDECTNMSRSEDDSYTFDPRSGVATDSYVSKTDYLDSVCTMKASYNSGKTTTPYTYTTKCTQKGKTTESSGSESFWPSLFTPELHVGSYSFNGPGVSSNITEKSTSVLYYDTKDFYPNTKVFISFEVEAYSLLPNGGEVSCGSITVAGTKALTNNNGACVITLEVKAQTTGSINVTPSVMSTSYFGYFLGTPSIRSMR